MSLSHDRSRECDPEAVFELVDGGLGQARRHDLREHLDACPGCGEIYRREMGLSRSLCSMQYMEFGYGSVSRSVAMALPTRRMRARFLWALLSVALLAVSLLALELYQSGPVGPVVDALGVFWGFVTGASDVVRAVFAAVGSGLLIALGLGAVFDLLVAAAVVTAVRRSRRA